VKIPLGPFWEILAVYLRPLWRRVILLTVLMLAGIGLQVANPQIIRYFLDTAQSSSDIQPLLVAGGLFLLFALLLQITTVTATYVSEDIGWTATNQLRADLALHCLELDMSFHNDRTPGQMIERIDGDVANLAIFFAQFVVQMLGSALLLVGVLVALFVEDWRIGLALAVYALCALGVLSKMHGIAVPRWKAAREASADLFGFIEEQLSGTEDVRSSGATQYVMRNLFKFGRVRLEHERAAGVANTLLVMTWLGLFTIGQVIAYSTGYSLFRDGTLSIGAVYLIIYYTDAIYRPLEQITEQIQNLQKAGASIERVQELYRTPVRILDGARTLPGGPLGLQFERVSFGYPPTKPAQNGSDPAAATAAPEGELKMVLRDISFSLAAGEVLGLLGHTGSGKTTLTRLLFRLFEPTAGAISLHDAGRLECVELQETQLDDLRHKVGMVTQDVQLFRATVRDNLTLFDRTISDERVLAVLADLGLDGWFRKLPDGLDTLLATGGSGLSAGEAQLLAFTRVFLKDPGLVILDEASSRLDPATEQLIERAVDKLLRGRTGIIIAHRLATVHRADQIVILDQGQIAEYGPYDELVHDPESRFAQLLRTGHMDEVLA
jgi:ATP-binding cassette subfamily B protein/ATP-binding cassette subfamily C protein